VPLATFFKKIPMVILSIITILLAYQLAQLTWAFIPETKPILLWEPVVENHNPNSEKINTLALQQLHLFGEASEKPTVQEKNVVNAPKTRLNLKLVGIVASNDPQYSSVIIAHKGKQGSYFIDSPIDGTRAIISQIYQDRVILDVGGGYQTLMLDGVDEQSPNQKAKAQTLQKNKAKKVIKESLKTVNLDREELLENPGKLTDYIHISPVREDGQVKGYRVKPGKNTTLFEQAGLKSGDLAVELNGIDLTDMKQAITLMKEFPTMTDMTLSIERSGQLHELYFSIP